MTCIVGIESKGHVWIGGDSAGTSADMSQRVIGDKKVFQNGNVLFGVCGLPKVMDVLAHKIEMPNHEKSLKDREFLARVLLPHMLESLRDAGCIKQHNGGDLFEGAILFGYKGSLYRIESNFQIITLAYGFDSIGSGSDIAIGSLHATMRERCAKNRIIAALEAAAINNAAVRPPYTVRKI